MITESRQTTPVGKPLCDVPAGVLFSTSHAPKDVWMRTLQGAIRLTSTIGSPVPSAWTNGEMSQARGFERCNIRDAVILTIRNEGN